MEQAEGAEEGGGGGGGVEMEPLTEEGQKRRLKVFEDKWLALNVEERDLERSVTDNILAATFHTQMLVALGGGIHTFVQAMAPCVGVGVMIFSAVSVASFVLSMISAGLMSFQRLRRLRYPIQHLQRRRSQLLDEVVAFNVEFDTDGEENLFFNVSALPDEAPSQPIVMDASFTQQLLDVKSALNLPCDFSVKYNLLGMVISVAFYALIFAISIPYGAGVMFCNNKKKNRP